MITIKNKTSITDVCNYLRYLAENQDDIFTLIFRPDGAVNAYRILNKGHGLEGQEISDFKALNNIIFTNTINKERTDLLGYMNKFLFNTKKGDGELIVAFDGRNKTTGMIALHNTNLGPALGGLREKVYSTFDSMLTDTLRLSRAMTYKAAIANTLTGGGKATRTPPEGVRKDANIAMARLVNFINYKRKQRKLNPYIVAEDSNTTCHDFDEMDEISEYVATRSLHVGGSGNPSPITAIGVYHAAKASAEFAFKDKKLDNKVVLLSGVGQVGYELTRNFIFNGVKKVICAELNEERIKWVESQFKRMRRTEKIEFLLYTKQQLKSQKFLHDLAEKVDIFTPCALGNSINDTNIEVLRGSRIKLICGAENNQLADEERHGRMLHEMGIVYVPDFVANAGGLINCATEIPGRMFLLSKTVEEAKKIENTVRLILDISRKKNIPTYLAANLLAEKRFLEE